MNFLEERQKLKKKIFCKVKKKKKFYYFFKENKTTFWLFLGKNHKILIFTYDKETIFRTFLKEERQNFFLKQKRQNFTPFLNANFLLFLQNFDYLDCKVAFFLSFKRKNCKKFDFFFKVKTKKNWTISCNKKKITFTHNKPKKIWNFLEGKVTKFHLFL